MSSRSETGHAKNVANFEDLISFCIGYGAAYNPSKDGLTIAKLQELQATAADLLQKTKVAKTGFDNATNQRQLVFSNYKPLATKIVNAVAVSGASKLAVADAQSINRKIQGTRAKAIPKAPDSAAPDTPADKTISTSQQSYDSIIDHYTKLIETVKQELSYKPNETELQTTTLQSKLDGMKAANTQLINSYTGWSNTIIQRNSTLYNPLTGLVVTSVEVKKYVKSIFGTSSPQYKQISSLEFKTIKSQ